MVPNHPSSLPTPELLPAHPRPSGVEVALRNPPMAGEYANVIQNNTRPSLVQLSNQVSPSTAPTFANTALPAIALLGVVAVTWNAMNMVISGKQRGIITGRKGKLV